MTIEELDILRGYGISAVIIAFVVIGLAGRLFPETSKKPKLYVDGIAGLIGGLGGLVVFFLFNFVSGWDEYFAAKESTDPVVYQGRHQAAAKVIKTLGEMDISALGVIFGVLGLILIYFAVVSFLSLRKT